jgi:hypothetical protein
MDVQAADRSGGQSLVTVAVVMVVLLASVALAVDVGNVYQERRSMQNAADAGALAGAWELCFGDPDMLTNLGQAQENAKNHATTVAEANGAQSVDVSFPRWFTVQVVARETTPTFFAGIIGYDQVDVGAVAEAACGAARSSCGLWPVALDQSRWNDLYAGGAGCNKDFLVWHGNNDDIDCTTYWCDCYPDNNGNKKCDLTDGDGINDVVGGESRQYVDFSCCITAEFPDECDQTGCGANELGCWILNEAGARIELGQCLPNLGGVRTAVGEDVDARIDDAVNIPLYDCTDCCEVQGTSNCPGGTSLHVSGFACIRPKQYVEDYELPRLDGMEPPWKGKIIRVQVNCDDECETYCGSSGEVPPEPWSVRAVSLIR